MDFATTATDIHLNRAAINAYVEANRAQRTDNPTTFTHESTTYTVAFDHHAYRDDVEVVNILSVTAN